KMKTSQSAIARIETGRENVTADTLERLIGALHGRFYVSIHPQECHVPTMMPWWEWLAADHRQYFMAQSHQPKAALSAWYAGANIFTPGRFLENRNNTTQPYTGYVNEHTGTRL